MTTNYMYLYLLSSALVIAFAAAIEYFYHTKIKKYPPGPKPLPIIGNLLDVPPANYERLLSSWRDIYGGIAYFRVFTTHFVVLNDYKIILELLDKRGTNYSSRPHLPMANLAGLEMTPLFLPYGRRLKTTRRLINNFMRKSTLEKQISIIETQTYECATRIAESPSHLLTHLKRHPADLILKISFGQELMDEDDKLFDTSEDVIDILSDAITPGKWIIDIFPHLKYFPSLLPGARFKRWASAAREKCHDHTRVFQDLINAIRINGDSYLPNFYTESSRISENESDDVLIQAASSMYLGLRANIYSMLKLFYETMASDRDIQLRMLAEIDSVVGDDRLPKLSDRDSLPYTNSVLKELLRLDPSMLPVVHSTDKDDTYEGYFIPKGSWIVANNWHFTHNPLIYSNPDKFDPERYWTTSTRAAEPDPSRYVFGYGRRACPGAQLGQMCLAHALVCSIWLFEISPAPESKNEYIHTPNLSRCCVAIRSERRMKLMRDGFASGDTRRRL